MTKRLSGLRTILERYDTFLLDQFGVLHDGRRVYPQAISVLREIKRSGKTVVVISNSGKRADANIRRMEGLGLGRELYDLMVTSGEVTWRLLADGHRDSPSMRGRRCLVISNGDDGLDIEQLGIERVSDAGSADLVLIAGGEGHRYPETHYREILRPAAGRSVDCLCSNPDRISLNGDDRHFGPGRIAEIYHELGGVVRFIGKPHPEIYDYILDRVGPIDRDRTLCVGDSIEHDIAGAAAANLDALLITDGILRGATSQTLRELSRRHGAEPDYLLARLVL